MFSRSSRISIVIPAAGESRRMAGEDKLLKAIDGMPLIRRAVIEALDSRACEVLVVIRPDQPSRASAIRDLSAAIVECPGAVSGMGASLACGISSVERQAAGALILLPDMPDIAASDLDALISRAHPDRIVRASDSTGRPGNPVLLPHFLFGEISRLSGDRGARDIIARHAADVSLVALDGNKAHRDLDTPTEWADWLSRRAGAGGGI